MTSLTEFVSAVAWFLFGIAAVLLTIFLLRLSRRLDRIIALAKAGAMDALPMIVRRLVGK